MVQGGSAESQLVASPSASLAPMVLARVHVMEGALAIGNAFDVSENGAGIIGEVDAALAVWRTEAEAVELGAEWVTRVEESFRRFG